MLTLLTRLVGPKLARPAAVILLVAALAAFAIALDRCAKRTMEAAVTSGRVQQQADELAATITRTEKANAAAQDLRRNPDAQRAECLRNNRNKAACD